MPAVSPQELVKRQCEYAKTHVPAPLLSEMEPAELAHTMIVICLDARVQPERMFKLEKLEEAIVVRNAGGRAHLALSEIVALDTLVGLTDVMIVHHTDCGTTHLTNAGMHKGLKARVPGHDAEVDAMDFGEILNGFDKSLKEDVAFLRASPFIKEDLKIHGYLWDIKTGELTTVVEG